MKARLFAGFALAACLLLVPLVRSGVRAGTNTLNLVAVGDSISASGTSGTSGHGGWVNAYSAEIDGALGTTTTVHDLGISHATSEQILASLRADQSQRDTVAAADVVTIQAGINDFLEARGAFSDKSCGGADDQDCLRAMISSFDGAWDQLIRAVRALSPNATLRAMTIYYPVAGFDEAAGTFPVLNTYLAQMNSHIAGTAAVAVADVHAVFNGADGSGDPYSKGYLLTDGLYPDDFGQEVIAFQLRSLGYAGIPGPRTSCADEACLPTRPPASRAAAPQARPATASGGSSRPLVAAAGVVALAFAAAIGGYAIQRRVRH